MEWLTYLGIGFLVGFAAGLLGIGGGVVMVPLLVLVFTHQGMPTEHVLHIAIGTALAAIGERVLVIDLDPQGNASTGLGIDRRHRRV